MAERERKPLSSTLHSAAVSSRTRLAGSPTAIRGRSRPYARAGPARVYRLEAPAIAVGAPANLVLLDTAATWRVEESSFRSRSANSWLLGETLKGQVRMTVAAGKVVHEA